MTDRPSQEHSKPSDRQVAAIIASGSAGVETAIRALEAGERAYFDAVAATASAPLVTTTAVSPLSHSHA
jgi:hypothetical protein